MNPIDICYRDMVLPRQLNNHGTMFGGDVCSVIDKAAANLLRTKTNQKFVTLLIDKLTFLNPIKGNDLVTVYGKIEKVGKTSVTIKVEAYATRQSEEIKVTESTLIFVAVNDEGQSIPFELRE